MPALSPLEATLLTTFCALLSLAAAVMVLLLRRMVARLEDAAATREILRQHPDLFRAPHWTGWTGSVGLTADYRRVAGTVRRHP